MSDANGAPEGDEVAQDADATEAPRPKRKMLLVIAIAALFILGGGGAAAWYFLAAAPSDAVVAEPPPETFVDVPPMQVMLRTADGGSRMLKVHVMLVPGTLTPEELTARLPMFVDRVQPFLRELRPEDLSGSAATFRVKEELLVRANQALGAGSVRDVLIQDLMQAGARIPPPSTSQQLVHYSQVEQSLQQTGVLKDILARLSGDDLTRAGQLIGRTAEFNSSVSGLSPQRPAEWRWSFPKAPASVEAEILDSSGRIVARPPIDPAASGSLRWDGALPGGAVAGEGAYVLRLVARDASGTAIAADLASLGTVAEVVSREGETWLGLGGVALPLDKLVRLVA
jgi:flagellar hook assembly protein FlgD/flagellar basal body-associated protein FliL